MSKIKNKLKLKNLFIIFILISISISNPKIFDLEQSNHEIYKIPILSSVLEPNFTKISYIHISTQKNSHYVNWELNGHIGNAVEGTTSSTGYYNDVFPGIYTTTITSLSMEDQINVETGELAADSVNILGSECLDASYEEGTYNYVKFRIKLRTNTYLRNDSYGLNIYGDSIGGYFYLVDQPTGSLSWSRYNESGTVSNFYTDELWKRNKLLGGPYDVFQMGLTYDLYLNLQLNSSFYDLNKIKVETYTPDPTIININYLDENEIETTGFTWKEQDPFNIMLNNPYYKLKITDKARDVIIFEDSELQSYKIKRIVNISDLQVRNNADEPINVSAIQNGHYQSSVGMSWDLGTPNTQPDGIESQSGLTYLQNEYEDHNKVLNLSGETSLNLQTLNWRDYKKDLFNESISDVQQFDSDSKFGFDYTRSVDENRYYQITDKLGRKNTLEFYDNSTEYLQVYKDFTPSSLCSLEYDWCFDKADSTTLRYFHLSLREGTSQRVIIWMNYGIIGSIRVQVPSSSYPYTAVKTGLTVNTWYHIKILIDNTNNEFYFYLDDQYCGVFSFYENNTGSGVNRIQFSTRDTPNTLFGYSNWLDCLSINTNSRGKNIGNTRDYKKYHNGTAVNDLLELENEIVDANGTIYTGYNDFDEGTHLNSYYFFDNHPSEQTYWSANLPTTWSDGTFSFYRLNNGTNYNTFRLQRSDGGAKIGFYMYGSNFRIYNYTAGGLYTISSALLYNTWQFIQITIDSTDITVFLDGTEIWSDARDDFEQYPSDPFQGIRMYSEISGTTGLAYIDCLRVNSDPEYIFEDLDNNYLNTNEEVNSTIEWWQNCEQNTTLDVEGLQFSFTNLNLTVEYTNGTIELIESGSQLGLWNRFTLANNLTHVLLYRNSIELFSTTICEMNNFTWISTEVYLDAIDYNLLQTNSDFQLGLNAFINTSEDLWCWNAFPNWENGHYQRTESWGTAINPDLSDWTDSGSIGSIVSSFKGHLNPLYISNSLGSTQTIYSPSFNEISGSIEYFMMWNNYAYYTELMDGGNLRCIIMYISSTTLRIYHDSSYTDVIIDSGSTNHIRIDFDCITDTYSVYINNVLEVANENFYTSATSTTLKSFRVRIGTGSNCFIDAISYSWKNEYFSNLNLLNNATIYPKSIGYNYSLQVNPYSSEIINYTISNYLVGIEDLYGNTLEVQSLENNSADNEIIYTPPNVRECFISLADQKNKYLDWENYKIYINDSLQYSNRFLREIASTNNISIYDRFGNYITSTLYTVQRDENFIPITLTLFNLKIYNQQEQFIYSNLSQANYYWSEWIAPGEFVKYDLIPGDYDLNITEFETSTSTVYEYSLAGDDYLLIQSENTFFNVLNNLENVNTTIGNQITNVAIDITNQNSEINNSIVNLDIYLTNVNSTLANILIDQNILLDAIQSDILNLEINQSILINAINETISNLIFNQNAFLELMNSTIIDLFVNQNIDLSALASDIYSYYLDQINKIDLTNSSICNLILDQAITLGLLNASLYSLNAEQLLAIEGINSTIMEAIVNQDAFLGLMNSSLYSLSIEQLASIEGVNSTIVNLLLNQEAYLHLIDANITNMMLSQEILNEMSGNITDLLIEQGIYLQLFESNITNLLLLQQNSLNFINNTIQYSFISINSSLSIIRSELTTINNEIGYSLYILNTSIVYMQNNLTQQISSVASNITDQFNQLSQNVFLINDSIYTVIAQLSQNISIDNTEILGNLELLLSYDSFLDDIKHTCLFSEDLNWTDTAHDYDKITDRVRTISFYNNDSIYESVLKVKFGEYGEDILSFTIPHDQSIDKMIPSAATYYKVEYANGTTIRDWTKITDSEIIWGIRRDQYAQAEVVVESNITSADFISAGILIALAVFLYTRSINRMKPHQLLKYSKKQSKSITRQDLTGPLDAFGDE